MGKFDLKAKRPLIIAGPCSAETEWQTIETCRRLAATGRVDMLRAGIWKPRTMPGNFEGAGSEALRWLVKAKEITGLPACIEVATADHLRLAVDYGIECVWIGARTTVNPFLTEEIARAAGEHRDLTVLIKNPLSPDIALWSGAIERFLSAGTPRGNIGMIHRGFSYFGHRRYRNAPMWHLIIDIRDRYPDIPLICDPSHMSGRREYIGEVAQTAADLLFDGLMIESHICPDNALSDAGQQLTVEDLAKLTGGIQWRKATADDPDFLTSLEKYRTQIDQIDSEIFELVSRRMEISDRIGKVKKENNVSILQDSRWREIVEKRIGQALSLNITPELTKTLLDAIHAESIDRQNKIMNKL